MKTTKIVLVFAALATALGAQPKRRLEKPEKVEKPVETIQPAPTPPPEESTADRFEIHASYAKGSKLMGYNDPRYLAADKTDYLKSDAMTANLEFTAKVPYRIRSGSLVGITDILDGVDYLRFGGQITGWSVLTGPGISIPKTGAPASGDAVSANIDAATRPGLGFYFGVGRQNMEIDLGLTVSLAFASEGSRTKYVTDATGVVQTDAAGNYRTEQVPGRGTFISDAFVLPTFRFAWGARDSLQFFISAGREQFEFQRDYLQSYFRLPFGKIFKLDLGIGLYPNATLFLQPNFEIGRVTIGLRGGIAVNYYMPELRRVGLADSLYIGASISGRF